MPYFFIYILMSTIKFDGRKGSNASCSSFQLLEIDSPLARFESWERKNIARRKRRSHGRKWSNSDGFPERDRSGRPNRFNTPTTVSIIRPRKTTIASFSFCGVVHRLFRRAIIFGTSLDRWQGVDGERGGGEGGRGRYPCEFTEANILYYLHEKSAKIHGWTKRRRFRATLSFSLFMYKSVCENTYDIFCRGNVCDDYHVVGCFSKVVCNVVTECSLN